MSTKSLHPVRTHRRAQAAGALAVLLGLTVGLTGCGDDDKKADETTETTAKKTTTTEAETSETTEADDTETTEPDSDSPFQEVVLGDVLTEIEGFTYEPLPDAAKSAMLESFASNAEVRDLVVAVGTTVVTNADGQSLLIFLGLNRELDEAETVDFVTGVTGGGEDVEQGEVAGETGYAFVSADGQQGFVTVRKDTVIMGMSDSTDHLSAVIQGLFAANPDL